MSTICHSPLFAARAGAAASRFVQDASLELVACCPPIALDDSDSKQPARCQRTSVKDRVMVMEADIRLSADSELAGPSGPCNAITYTLVCCASIPPDERRSFRIKGFICPLSDADAASFQVAQSKHRYPRCAAIDPAASDSAPSSVVSAPAPAIAMPAALEMPSAADSVSSALPSVMERADLSDQRPPAGYVWFHTRDIGLDYAIGRPLYQTLFPFLIVRLATNLRTQEEVEVWLFDKLKIANRKALAALTAKLRYEVNTYRKFGKLSDWHPNVLRFYDAYEGESAGVAAVFCRLLYELFPVGYPSRSLAEPRSFCR